MEICVLPNVRKEISRRVQAGGENDGAVRWWHLAVPPFLKNIPETEPATPSREGHPPARGIWRSA